MNGELYINLAKSLAIDLQEEKIRCAISRYYYGLLHKSIEKLIELNPDLSDLKDNLTNPPVDYKYSIHSSTIYYVKLYNNITGGDLDIARELRVLSDYDFEKAILNKPLNVIKNGEEVIKSFDSINDVFKFLEETSEKIATLKKDKVGKQSKTSSLSNRMDFSKILKKW